MRSKASDHWSEPAESDIQQAAYFLWLESGRPTGRDREMWFAARELLRHRSGPRGRAATRNGIPGRSGALHTDLSKPNPQS